MEPLPLYHYEKLKLYIGDNQEALKEMLALFIDSTVDNMREIEKAFEQQNTNQLAKAVHKLKPTLDVYSIDILYEPVRNLEKQAMAGESTDNIKALYEFVMSTLNDVVDAMQKDLK